MPNNIPHNKKPSIEDNENLIVPNAVVEIETQSNEEDTTGNSSGENITLKNFPISPSIDITGADGRSYEINAGKVTSNHQKRKVDIPIYVRHNFWEGAYGWVKTDTLRAENNQFRADIEFNKKGSELIHSKEFRYLSPTYVAPKNSLKNNNYQVLFIYEVSLVNHPNLQNDPVSNCVQRQDDEEDLSTTANNKGEATMDDNTQQNLLNQQKIEQLEKQQKDLLEKNEALQKEIDEAAAKHREMLVNNAIDQGQLAPGKKDFSLSLNESQLKTFLETEKGTMEGLKQQLDVEQNKQQNSEQLSDDEKQINGQLGLK